jgi:hypothetical protein
MDANDYDEAGSSSQVQFRVGDSVWCGYLHCEVLASAGNNYTLKGPHGRICCSAAALSLYPPSGAPPLELLEQELNFNAQVWPFAFQKHCMQPPCNRSATFQQPACNHRAT